LNLSPVLYNFHHLPDSSNLFPLLSLTKLWTILAIFGRLALRVCSIFRGIGKLLIFYFYEVLVAIFVLKINRIFEWKSA
jgi:hypothetical protein